MIRSNFLSIAGVLMLACVATAMPSFSAPLSSRSRNTEVGPRRNLQREQRGPTDCQCECEARQLQDGSCTECTGQEKLYFCIRTSICNCECFDPRECRPCLGNEFTKNCKQAPVVRQTLTVTFTNR